jgi:putative ABC transport system permease protein
MSDDITWVGLASSLVLVALAVALSRWRKLSLEAGIVWASLRALAQLLLVGVALEFVLPRNLAWSWAWVAIMVVFAAETVRRRAGEVPGVFGLALGAFALASAVTLGVLFGFGIFPLEPATLVTLAGLTAGNCMTATVVVGRRVLDGLRDRRDEVEARLALGLSSSEAAGPTVRDALRTALVPQIERTKTVGVVFLPGTLTGLILGGASPLGAVRIQLAVMYLILGSAATTTAVVALGVRRRVFTADHRLVLPHAATR